MSPEIDHLFVTTGLITVAFQLCFFAVAAYFRFDKVTDLAGSSNFVLLALYTLWNGGMGNEPRQQLVTCIVVVSRVELALFLFTRVLVRGKDERFDKIRTNLLRFLGFWVYQMIWVWVVSLPVTYVNTQPGGGPLSALDYVGAFLAVFGFVFEVVADVHKYRFRGNPANEGRALTTGLWAWSRHPNYFGEILHWFGVALMAVPVVISSQQYIGLVSFLSPALTFWLLMYLSGVPTSEGKWIATKYHKTTQLAREYDAYRASTSVLIPMPPSLYRALPQTIKSALLCERTAYQNKAKA